VEATLEEVGHYGILDPCGCAGVAILEALIWKGVVKVRDEGLGGRGVFDDESC